MSNDFDWDDFKVVSEEDVFDGFTVVEGGWEGFSEVEDLLPEPFYQTQQDVPEEAPAPSSAFTNPNVDLSGNTMEKQDGVNYYVEDSRGRTDGTEQDTANYEQRYKQEGGIDHSNPYWKQFGSAGAIVDQLALDKEKGQEFPTSYVNAGDKEVGGEAEGVQSQESTNEAAKETAINQISNIAKGLASDPENAGKSPEEIWEQAKYQYAEDAGETVFTALTLPAGLGSTLLSMVGKGALYVAGEEALGELSRAAAGEKVDVSKSVKEVGKGAAVGGAFGLGGKALEKGASGIARLWDKANGTEALEKLNKMGKSTKNFENTSGKGSPDKVDHIVGKDVSAEDIAVASEDVSNLLRMNEDGAKLGTQSLARATENPEIQKLLKEAATKVEKFTKAIPGEGSVFQEKLLENVGLRSKNLKADRGEALKKASHRVDNNLDEVVEMFSKEVKEGSLGKEVLSETKTFVRHLKSARAASVAGNTTKYNRQVAAAEKKLESLGEGDEFVEKVLRTQLNSVKTSSKIASTSTHSKENPVVAELAALTLGGTSVMGDGLDWHDPLTGGALAFLLSKGRGKINKSFSKSANKRSKQVEKALKGDLGALKSKYKQIQAMQKGTPDGALLRAYMALNNEE